MKQFDKCFAVVNYQYICLSVVTSFTGRPPSTSHTYVLYMLNYIILIYIRNEYLYTCMVTHLKMYHHNILRYNSAVVLCIDHISYLVSYKP